MPRLTDEERQKRRQKMQEEALQAVAARGQFNFRLDGEDIRRLYELAGKRSRPVSAMVREWVLERLEMEEHSKCPTPLWAEALGQRLAHTEAYLLIALCMDQNRESLKKKLRDHLHQHFDLEGDEELRALLAQ